MPAKLTIHPTRLEFGYFYVLWNNLFDPEDDWILSDDPTIYPYSECTVVDEEYKEVQRFKCRENSQHGRKKEPFNYVLDITYIGQPYGMFIREHDHVVISGRLAEQLKRSGLKGWRVLPCKIRDNPEWFKDEKSTPLPHLYQLAFDGIAPWMRPHVEPRLEDKCPFCATGPLVCSECGEWRDPCKHCGKEWCVSLKEHRGRTDPRVVIDPNWPDVFDIRHWDGSDFMGASHAGRITRRALDWLLSIHAAPFRAEPVPVNVAGLTKAELARLEEVRKPLPNVTPPALEKFTKKPREK